MNHTLRFLSYEKSGRNQMEFGTPSFVYDEETLRLNARTVKNSPTHMVYFPRYAMKAAPTAAILRIFNQEGLGIDASSVHEVERAVRAGFGTESISLSTQELSDDFIYWAQDGVKVNLCSINQIHKFGKMGKNKRVGLRFNPGKGSGGTNRTIVGGPASSFGIWKDDLEKALSLCQEYKFNGRTDSYPYRIWLRPGSLEAGCFHDPGSRPIISFGANNQPRRRV